MAATRSTCSSCSEEQHRKKTGSVARVQEDDTLPVTMAVSGLAVFTVCIQTAQCDPRGSKKNGL